MIDYLKNLFGPMPSPKLTTHSVYAEIHVGDTGNWVLFFYNAEGVLVLEKTGTAPSKETGVKRAVAARNKLQSDYKRIAQ